MLPATIESGKYNFLVDNTGGFYILLVDSDLSTESPFTPIWVREAADEHSMTALTCWLAIRREHWQAWGKLAQTAGSALFSQHFDALIKEHPLEAPGGIALSQLGERQISIGKVLSNGRTARIEQLYVHTFRSAEHRARFTAWAHEDADNQALQGLEHLGLTSGSIALGIEVERIASEWTPPSFEKQAA